MNFAHALLAAALLSGSIASAGETDLPTQKPGLWQITMTSTKIPGGSKTYKMCQDATSIAAGKATADGYLKDCSRNSLRREGETWTSDSECTMSGLRVVSHSEMTVHGTDTFHTQVQSTIGKGKMSTTMIDHRYLGACAAGQAVGVPIEG